MHARSLVALGVSISLLAATAPHARAEEALPETEISGETTVSAPALPPLVGLRAPDVLALTSSALRAPALTHATTSSLDLAAKAPSDIRLSRGAKTAIIVTAIVVGVLIIAGVVVVSKPHRHL